MLLQFFVVELGSKGQQRYYTSTLPRTWCRSLKVGQGCAEAAVAADRIRVMVLRLHPHLPHELKPSHQRSQPSIAHDQVAIAATIVAAVTGSV